MNDAARSSGTTPPGPSSEGSGLDGVVAALATGAVVAIPTDTVYGLAVDPRQAGATESLFVVKRRPEALVLPVLVAGTGQADALAGPDGLSSMARRLARRFWPGSLTIVVERRLGIDWELGGDGRTIGLRCPAHPLARRLCQMVGPLATTSANRHGEPPMTTASAVAEEFGGSVAVVVDGGVCGGTPSTVIDVTGNEVRCLREGAVAWNEIALIVSQD